MEGNLAVLKGLQEGNVVDINSIPYVIGRSRTANFIIVNVHVSRNHCQIIREDNLWKICDCSSSGTYVNDELVGRGKSKVLHNGNVIRFGPVESNLSWTFYTLTGEKGRDASAFKPQVQVLFGQPTEENVLNLEKELVEKLSDNIGPKKILQEVGIKSPDKVKNEIKGSSSLGKNLLTENNILLNMKTENERIKVGVEILEDQFVKKELEDKLMKQEEEKNLLLEKLKEMEEAQKILFQKLNENQSLLDSVEKTKPLKVEEEIKESSSKEESTEESRKDMTTEELIKELEQVKSALNVLEDKNSTLEGQLAAASGNKVTSSKSDLLEDAMEAELTCTICSELFVTAITLSCTHTFCQHCINQWKKKQKTCPICRKKITNETRSLVVDNYIDKMVENLSADLKRRRQTLILERKEKPPKKRLKSRK